MNATLIGFVCYLILMLYVGVITFRTNRTHADFFLAGRRLNPWVVAFSERASGESAWLILGLPGAALATGLVNAWTALGCVLGIIFYWYYLAQDLRIATEKVDAVTLPHFFAQRFGGDDRWLRTLSALIILFFYTFYLAAQFSGAGKTAPAQ